MIKLHSCTSLFAKNTYERVVLLNSSWTHLSHIQVTHAVDITPRNMYYNFGQSFKYIKKYFIGVQEENTPSNFVPLIREGVKVEPYDHKNIAHKPVFFPQPHPDTIFIFKGSNFKDQRNHALDQKTNSPGLGKNLMLSEISILLVTLSQEHLLSIIEILNTILRKK